MDLLRQFEQRNDWNEILPEDAEQLSLSVANFLPAESLSNPNDVISILLMYVIQGGNY